ncbi:glycosyltransferase family 4 protein [Pelagibacteraceae bacterium]|nr:glycosyltransferase family 4 protein [Pelagibacteraceae bacterium]|tara:strand:+ start:15 stop:1157 length:1143 start_codon:yes stop_codon:yes gene_type:complete
MTIAIDFVGTNLGSGTKTYNINFCNELSSLDLTQNIKIFICKNYLKELSREINENNQIEYVIKPNFLSITLLRLLWMQFIFPFQLKLMGIKKLYSPMNFSPLIAKFLNIKVILCLHSNLPWVYFDLMPGNLVRNFVTKKMMELSIKSCDLLIVVSQFAKKEIIEILKIDLKKIEVVYLNINKKYFSLVDNKKLIKNFDYESKYILSVMSCVRYHNIINLLKAYKKLTSNLDFDIKLVLVLQILDKSYFLEIEKFIKSNFKENQIVIFSNLSSENLPNLYRYAELYVFTSYCEVFGLTSLEAMSQKTPVVISNKSSLPEINGNAAIYFDPDDIDEITNSLKMILMDNTLRQKLIEEGIAQLEKYNSNDNIKKTISIIKNIN